jgi:hypothetical protein
MYFKNFLKGSHMKPHTSPHMNKKKKSIEFYVHNDCALQISLSGSFNHCTGRIADGPGQGWKLENRDTHIAPRQV